MLTIIYLGGENLKYLTLLLLISISAFTAVPHFMMKDMLEPVEFNRTYEASEFNLTSQTRYLTTTDGLSIIAHEVKAEEPKAVIIFLSGIHNPSVTAFFGHAKMLLAHDYASFLVEMRAHVFMVI